MHTWIRQRTTCLKIRSPEELFGLANLHQRIGQTLVGCCCMAVACATLTSQSFCQTRGNWMLNSALRQIQTKRTVTVVAVVGIIFTIRGATV